MIAKQQTTIVNISVTVASAGALAFLGFLAIRDLAARRLKLAASQILKSTQYYRTIENSRTSKSIQTSYPNVHAKIQIPTFIKDERLLKPTTPTITAPTITPLKTAQRQSVAETIELPNKSPKLAPKTNGCPKNLPYFNMKPRPKLTPEECFSCKNLITCVCMTSE